ncbi:MAG: T9SS type A sorting domain-containing protein, partial [Bacteroidota bacterium]
TQSAYLVVRDNVTSSEAGGAVFTLQAHGNGEESAGTMRLDAANQVAVYAAGEVGLEVGLNEVDGSGRLQSRQATRETAFAQAGPYTVTELVTARQAEAAFGSVYVPRVPGRSAQVNVEQGWFEVGTDLVFNSAATNVIGGWTAEARQAVVRRAGEDWQLIALVGGQSIRRLDRPVVSVGGTDEALNVLIERVGASELSIRAQAEATLVVHDVPAPSAVQNAPDLQYEASDRTLRFSVAPGLQTRLSFPQPISSEHGTPESIRPRAFPNPTSGRLTVEAGTDRQPTEFEVYDLLGRLVRSGTFTRSTTLDTSGWPAGHYFVALKTGTHREVIAITALR